MSNFPIKPLLERVFVQKDEADKVGDFFVPDTVKGRAPTGIVVAVGPGRFSVEKDKFVPLTVKVGDRVFVKAFDGYRIEFEEHKVFVFSENDIIGIIR